MRLLKALMAALILVAGGLAAPAALAKGEPPAAAATAAPDFSWVDKLSRQTGQVDLAQAKAKLNLGDDYYFLDAAESRRVGQPARRRRRRAGDGVPQGVRPRRSARLGRGDHL